MATQLPTEGEGTIVLEATLQWAWFHDRLPALGYRVLVAHPQQLKLISQARGKTDPIDARKLAEWGRVNLVPAIWVPAAATRARRLRLRSRARLVRWRTRLKNRIHALLAEQNLVAPGTDLFGVGGRAWLAAVAVAAPVRAEITVALELIASLDTQLGRYDQMVRRWAQTLPEAQLLQSVPGIGPFGALLILAELGLMARFRSSHELVAYAGLVPSTRSSGGKTAHGGRARCKRTMSACCGRRGSRRPPWRPRGSWVVTSIGCCGKAGATSNGCSTRWHGRGARCMCWRRRSERADVDRIADNPRGPPSSNG